MMVRCDNCKFFRNAGLFYYCTLKKLVIVGEAALLDESTNCTEGKE